MKRASRPPAQELGLDAVATKGGPLARRTRPAPRFCPSHHCIAERNLGDAGAQRWTSLNLLVILMTMTVLSLADVKSHLSELIGRVNSQHERVTVTVHGRPSAVLLAVDDLDALEETIAILADSDALRQLAASDAELSRGQGESIDALTRAMKRRRTSA